VVEEVNRTLSAWYCDFILGKYGTLVCICVGITSVIFIVSISVVLGILFCRIVDYWIITNVT